MRRLRIAIVVILALLAPAASRASLIEEDRTAITSDGWRLALHRYKPDAIRFAEPVLLTHGFIEDRRIWDLDAEHSLARALAARGFDVWTMDLRGSGASQAPPVTSLRGWNFSIHDFVGLDAPAAIGAVLGLTGAERLMLVGHSLGGLIVYATLEGPLAARVRAAVTIAGAGTMSAGPGLQLRFDRFFKLLGVTLGPVLPADAPFPVGSTLHALLGENDRMWEALGWVLDSPLGHPYWAEGNMSPELVTRLMRTSVTNTSLNVVRQFLDYAKAGKVEGVTDRLGEIRTPLLAIAGTEDLVIPAADVRTVAALSGAKYLEISGAGHEDLCVGLSAPSKVYPRVADWLESHASPGGL